MTPHIKHVDCHVSISALLAERISMKVKQYFIYLENTLQNTDTIHYFTAEDKREPE